MKFKDLPITVLVDWLAGRQYCAVAGYSDAEWYSILGEREGERTGLGQVLSSAHGGRLLDVIGRRYGTPGFHFAVPRVLKTLPGLDDGRPERLLRERFGIKRFEVIERDAWTDDLARDAGLFPFINQLRRMNVVMIGPGPIRVMTRHLPVRHFVEISTPNLHGQPGGIEAAVADALSYGRPAAYLVSAGVSAAVIIDQLYDRLPESWLLDCGSIWDAFAGIGGQRAWRAALYADPDALYKWELDNLYGKDRLELDHEPPRKR